MNRSCDALRFQKRGGVKRTGTCTTLSNQSQALRSRKTRFQKRVISCDDLGLQKCRGIKGKHVVGIVLLLLATGAQAMYAGSDSDESEAAYNPLGGVDSPVSVPQTYEEVVEKLDELKRMKKYADEVEKHFSSLTRKDFTTNEELRKVAISEIHSSCIATYNAFITKIPGVETYVSNIIFRQCNMLTQRIWRAVGDDLLREIEGRCSEIKEMVRPDAKHRDEKKFLVKLEKRIKDVQRLYERANSGFVSEFPGRLNGVFDEFFQRQEDKQQCDLNVAQLRDTAEYLFHSSVCGELFHTRVFKYLDDRASLNKKGSENITFIAEKADELRTILKTYIRAHFPKMLKD